MPPLALTDRSTTIDKQQILWHLNFPFLDVAVVRQIIERQPELTPKILQRLGSTTTEVAQRRHLDWKRLSMAGEIELQPAREILTFKCKALLSINQRVRNFTFHRISW